jgi:hypothetical protein
MDGERGDRDGSVAVIPNTMQVTGALKTPDTLAVDKGPAQKIIMSYAAQTVTDQMITIDNVIPASNTDIMNRTLSLEYEIQVHVAGATAAGPPAVALPAPPYFRIQPGATLQFPSNTQTSGEGLYLRSRPMNQACVNATCKINGVAQSIPLQSISPILDAATDLKMTRYTDACSYPLGRDLNGTYNELASPGIGRPRIVDYALNDVPAPVFSHPVGRPTEVTYQPRSMGFLNCTLIAAWNEGGNAHAVYVYHIQEDIVIPPFTFGNGEAQDGICQVQNLSLLLTLGDLRRMMAYVWGAGRGASNATVMGPGVLAAFDVSLVKSVWGVNQPTFYTNMKPTLRVTYSTPDPLMAQSISSFVAYPYTSYAEFRDTLSPGAAAQITRSITKTLNAVKLTNCPRKIAIGVRVTDQWLNTVSLTGDPDTAVLGACYTNHWLPISALNLTWNTRSGVFCTYSKFDLYSMSRKNGLKMSYDEWLHGGGPVIIDTAFDIGLGSTEAAGQAIPITLQFTITYSAVDVFTTANDYQAVTYEAYTLCMTPARCIIGGGTSVFAIQGPSQSQVLSLLRSGTSHNFIGASEVPAEDDGAKTGDLKGGGLFHNVGNFLRTAGHHALKFAADNPGVIADGAKALGKKLFGGDISGGDISGGDVSGGGYNSRKHQRAR